MVAGRKKTFTNVEIFYIHGHVDTLTPEQIAEDLQVKNVDTIREIVDEFKATRPEPVPKMPNAFDMMNRVPERAMIMTPSASMRGDVSKSAPDKTKGDGVYVIKRKNG